ncbi:MAG: alginate lyase family protein, partial [Terriglobia bacterium]
MLRQLPKHFGLAHASPGTLLRMLRGFHSPTEFAFRSVYELSKAAGLHRRWFFRPCVLAREEVFASLRVTVPDEEKLLAYLRERESPRFFLAGSRPEEFQALLEAEFPQSRAELVQEAERYGAGEFAVFGRPVAFPGEVDWHALVAHPGRWPLAHWSEVDVRSVDKLADVKFCWELNRHQHFYALGRAYWATGKERYAQTFARHLLSWVQQNPPEMGVNWASSLEVSLRSIAWIWALHFFLRSPSLTPEAAFELVRGLLHSGRHLYTDIWYSAYCIPRNNHLVGEVAGLFLLGFLFPEFKESRRWRRRALAILLRECRGQVLADGVSSEMATSYHRFTLYFFLLVALVLERNGQPAPAALRTRVEQMIEFLHQVQTPWGSIPQIGDWDDGRVVALSTSRIEDVRPTLATGAALFGRGEWKFAAGPLSEEVWWLLGPQGVDAFRALEASPPSATAARFSRGGFYALRSRWHPEANYLLFRCGRHWGHGHYDQLHVDVVARGRQVLVDSGTYTYSGDLRWRQFFRGAPAHNTVVVDGEDQSVSYGTFR